jgi:hypothetical protein
MVAAYVIHVIDEWLFGGSFVEEVSSIGGRNTLVESSFGLTQTTSSL